MIEPIKLTTEGRAAPPHIRARVIVVLCVFGLFSVMEWFSSDSDGMTPLAGSASLYLLLIESALGFLFVVASGLFAYALMMGMRQRLTLSGECIEWHSRLPQWLGKGQTSWSVARVDVRNVTIDLSKASINPLSARVVFDCTGVSRSVRLLGWHRLEDGNGTSVSPRPRVVESNWRADTSKLPLVVALREAGFHPIVIENKG